MAEQEKSRRRDDRRDRGPREVKEFDEHMLQLDRVTRVVKGGRRMRFRATVIIGDHAGKVGLGLGKGADVQVAMKKAVADAKKHIITVPLTGDATITHPIELKYKAAHVRAIPARDGTGLKLGGALRKVFEIAGVKNILGKNFGTSNRVVVAQCAMQALQQLRMTKASEKFLAGVQEQRKAEQAKKRAAMEANDAAGRDTRRGDKRGPRRDDRKEAVAEAVKKLDGEQGRLEQEAGK